MTLANQEPLGTNLALFYKINLILFLPEAPTFCLECLITSHGPEITTGTSKVGAFAGILLLNKLIRINMAVNKCNRLPLGIVVGC